MYNDELDVILEDAYDEGYYQALADMGYEFDDIADEDVDIFDEDCFDDAVESGKARYDSEGKPLNNKAKKRDYIKEHGGKMNFKPDSDDARYNWRKRRDRSRELDEYKRTGDKMAKATAIVKDKKRNAYLAAYDTSDGKIIQNRANIRAMKKGMTPLKIDELRTEQDRMRNKKRSDQEWGAHADWKRELRDATIERRGFIGHIKTNYRKKHGLPW